MRFKFFRFKISLNIFMHGWIWIFLYYKHLGPLLTCGSTQFYAFVLYFIYRNNMLRMFKGDKSFIPRTISVSQFMIVSWTPYWYFPFSMKFSTFKPLRPLQTSIFSLTSFSWQVCVYGQQVFLDKFSLTSFPWQVLLLVCTEWPPFVCQNHRSISSTLVKFSLAAVDTNKLSLPKNWHN
jgi:hypothetical protein